ncbi:uncharacterized protein FIESC28_07687 [Fusarium coffeatum]|uniref:Uncharacterized protein n=1 Tax=Fusarium coffeatum TaxID=231269 RepID=A0A366RBC7_9HYPO|nr:uncharacterized protein FIESC28_07687 [Fusarium coffeatum]RBR14451.1 hypothetical protein FIESC28_07687 [Fusarium coffeatum]
MPARTPNNNDQQNGQAAPPAGSAAESQQQLADLRQQDLMHDAVIRHAQRQLDKLIMAIALWAWIDERRGANNAE